jgi:hypothetical protein
MAAAQPAAEPHFVINIAVIIPANHPRSWQIQVVERLRAAGHAVAIGHSEEHDAGSRALDGILWGEALRFRTSLVAPATPLAAGAEVASPDLVVDLTGGSTLQNAPVVSLLFDGHSSLSSAARALIMGRLPDLTILVDGKPVGTARPMVSERIWLTRALNDVLARAITLIERTVRRFAAGTLDDDAALPAAGAGPLTPAAALRHAFSLGPRLLLRAVHKGTHRPFHWQVGYRLLDGPGAAETGGLAGAAWTLLEDDGTRFYADPFPFSWQGRDYLFVEEYPHASGKGVISVAQLDARGHPSVPRVVLEVDHHLSYPQVFARDGAIWMLPESSGARRLALYRAEQFPDRWVMDTVLLDGVDISDATLLEHGGRLWLFASVGDGLGSASDSLHVYSATSLRGPWLPHAQNPIQIDRAAARPGGSFVRSGDGVALPMQDGTQTYGGGLGLARLLELDEHAVRLAPPVPVAGAPSWPFSGIHTLNRAGRLEVIDGIRPRLRWGRRR